jgi:hypothetical protein
MRLVTLIPSPWYDTDVSYPDPYRGPLPLRGAVLTGARSFEILRRRKFEVRQSSVGERFLYLGTAPIPTDMVADGYTRWTWIRLLAADGIWSVIYVEDKFEPHEVEVLP